MKKLKLLVAAVLIFVMAFSFTACASNPIVGEWRLQSAYVYGETATTPGPDTRQKYGDMSFVFEEDGTGTLTYKKGSTKQTLNFEWELNKDGDKVSLEIENRYDYGYPYKGDEYFYGTKIEILGENSFEYKIGRFSFYFEKQ